MLTVCTLDDADKWDRTVRSFAEHNVYYLSGYAKALMLHGDGEPLLFYCENETARGINAVMRRDISRCEYFEGRLPPNTFFDLSTPYGCGGWLIEGDKTDGIFSEYENLCRQLGIVSEFVRFDPVLKNHEKCLAFYGTVPLGKTVTMDISSPELIWANLTSKNRNMIRKAIKSGVSITHGCSGKLMSEFCELYYRTMDRDSASAYYYFGKEYFDCLLNELNDNIRIFCAHAQGRVISSALILAENGRMSYHLAGSLREYGSFAAGNLLLYEAALWGCEAGCKTLYLGGGVGSGDDNLLKFKRSFCRGDGFDTFHIGKKVFDAEKYSELIRMRSGERSDFFPQYRG